MLTLKPLFTTHNANVQTSVRTVTTLYDLMESLNVEVAPGEDELVIAAMKDIMNTQQLTFLGLHHAHRVMCT